MSGGEGKSKEGLHENFPRVVWTAWLRWPVIVDDVGRKMRAFTINAESIRADPRLAVALNSLHGVPTRGPQTAMVERRGSILRAIQIATVALTLVGLLVAKFMLASMGSVFASAMSFYAVIFASVILCLLTINYTRRRTTLWNIGPQIVAAFLKHGCCPACGYGLKQETDNTQKLVTCSECAASWNADRIDFADDSSAIKPSESVPALQPRRFGRVAFDAARNAHFVAETTPIPSDDPAILALRREIRPAEWPLRMRSVWLVRFLLVGSVVAMLASSLLANMLGWSARTMFFILVGAMGGFGLSFLLSLLRSMATGRRYTKRRLLPIFFRHGRCPTCVGPLGDEREGLRTCGQCGVVWRPLTS